MVGSILEHSSSLKFQILWVNKEGKSSIASVQLELYRVLPIRSSKINKVEEMLF
jgi:hypothetical protein